MNPVGKGMGMAMQRMAEANLGTEVIYSFVIIACSLMIYFSTKELYELSNHKGIKYFRLSFLYFALAYFFRSFVKFILVSLNTTRIFDFSMRGIGVFTYALFVYFGSMSILYLLNSVLYKKSKNERDLTVQLQVIAISIAVISLFVINPFIHLGIHILFFIGVICAMILAKKTQQKKHLNLYLIYSLLFAFWILNLLDFIIPSFFRTIQILIYLASVSVFLMILYKVIRKTGVR